MQLLDILSRRIVGVLERRGLLIADTVDPYLDFKSGSSLAQLQASSINAQRLRLAITDLRSLHGFNSGMRYSIAIGPRAGRKAVALYSVPPLEEEPNIALLATMSGADLGSDFFFSASIR